MRQPSASRPRPTSKIQRSPSRIFWARCCTVNVKTFLKKRGSRRSSRFAEGEKRMNERERREEDARGNAEHLASVRDQSASGRMTAGEAEDGFICGRQLHTFAELGTCNRTARNAAETECGAGQICGFDHGAGIEISPVRPSHLRAGGSPQRQRRVLQGPYQQKRAVPSLTLRGDLPGSEARAYSWTHSSAMRRQRAEHRPRQYADRDRRERSAFRQDA